MASRQSSTTPDTDEPQAKQPEQPEQHGTGVEPSANGVHVPGSAPGQYQDLGPVTIPADAPRQEH